MRLPFVILKYPTCKITDNVLTTKTKPRIGIYNSIPEKTERLAINEPRASDPVSPINIFAGKQLNKRKHKIEPQATTEIIEMFLNSAMFEILVDITPVSIKIFWIIKNVIKNINVVDEAKPSRPSVKLTAFVVAK